MARDKNQAGRRAGFSDSRIPPAAGIVESAHANDLALECPADRTLVKATLNRARHPRGDYAPAAGADDGGRGAAPASSRLGGLDWTRAAELPALLRPTRMAIV